MDSAEELTFQDSAFIQTAKQPCGAADLPEQRRGPSLPATSSLASSMAAAAEEQALVVRVQGRTGACLAAPILRCLAAVSADGRYSFGGLRLRLCWQF